jgi:hypothetical protein
MGSKRTKRPFNLESRVKVRHLRGMALKRRLLHPRRFVLHFFDLRVKRGGDGRTCGFAMGLSVVHAACVWDEKGDGLVALHVRSVLSAQMLAGVWVHLSSATQSQSTEALSGRRRLTPPAGCRRR